MECRTLGLRQFSLEVQLGSGQWVCGEGPPGALPPLSLCSPGSRALLRAPLCPLGLGLWALDMRQLLRGGKRSPQAASCTTGLQWPPGARALLGLVQSRGDGRPALGTARPALGRGHCGPTRGGRRREPPV